MFEDQRLRFLLSPHYVRKPNYPNIFGTLVTLSGPFTDDMTDDRLCGLTSKGKNYTDIFILHSWG